MAMKQNTVVSMQIQMQSNFVTTKTATLKLWPYGAIQICFFIIITNYITCITFKTIKSTDYSNCNPVFYQLSENKIHYCK